jgi:hypothetical protein
MKRSLGLLTGCLFIFGMLQAQQKTSKLFAEISFGPSIPLGRFSEKTYVLHNEKEQPGMAKIGLSGNVTVGYYLKENVGVLLLFGYSSNEQQPGGWEEYMKNRWYPTATGFDITTKKWELLKAMGGGFLVTPLAEHKLNLVTKLSAGVCYTKAPYWGFRIYNENGTLQRFAGSKEKLPAAFCFQISVGLQYKMNDKVYLLLDVNSFNATAAKDYTYYQDAPVPGMPDTIKRKYKLGSFNALAGVGINF